MNLAKQQKEENSAYLQLLMIVLFAIGGLVAGTLLSFLVIVIGYGKSGLADMQMLTGENKNLIDIIKIAQVLTTGFLFILPPVLLARVEKAKLTDFYGFKKPYLLYVLLVILIMIFSMPVIEWVGIANQKMVLPESLKFVENWMRAKEDEAMKMTILLLKINNTTDFLINLFIIALLPAVAEEFIFRGAVQRSFYRMFRNPHIAIWITAIIFSAIHFQFFGFFPRLLLGALFGYIYWWTGSLWYTMLAHFLNNGYAVCMAWYMQAHHLPLENLENTSTFNWYQCVISLLLTIFLLIFLQFKTKQSHGEQLG
jgi:membrane protease YdiL (CAAX protease family)